MSFTTSRIGRRRVRGVLRPVLHIIVGLFMVIWFTPVLGLLVSTVRTQNDNATTGWWHAFVAPLFTGYNYQQAISVVDLGPSALTTIAIAIPVTVLTALLSAIGGFALTRLSFPGRTALSLLLVGLLVTPPQVTLVPMLRFFNLVGLSGSVPAVWIFQVGFVVPFGIFLVRGFIATIPVELFEAAALEGAGMLRLFTSIVLPLALPAIASLAILQFLWSWNDLLIPLLFLGGSDLENPLTVQVAGLVQQTGSGQSLMLAATFISVLLPLIVVIAMQRYFVRGILGGSIK